MVGYPDKLICASPPTPPSAAGLQGFADSEATASQMIGALLLRETRCPGLSVLSLRGG
jgi:hypothetical protein